VRIALDTNILVYAEGANGPERRDDILGLLRKLPPQSVVVPAQVLGELFHVLVRKAGRSRKEARTALLSWRDGFAVLPTSNACLSAACDLSADHQFGIWDAIVLAAASQAGCRLLLSEDLQDGFTWGGVTVANPFRSPPNLLLAMALEGGSG
jgi:predicted nucleic acid-binding protein